MSVSITKTKSDSTQQTVTFQFPQDFELTLTRLAQSVPLGGNETEGDVESGAMVFDTGGTQITYTMTFIERFTSDTDYRNRILELFDFFATVQIMSSLILEITEFGWTTGNSKEKHCVVKNFKLRAKKGEKNIIYFTVVLLGGTTYT